MTIRDFKINLVDLTMDFTFLCSDLYNTEKGSVWLAEAWSLMENTGRLPKELTKEEVQELERQLDEIKKKIGEDKEKRRAMANMFDKPSFLRLVGEGLIKHTTEYYIWWYLGHIMRGQSLAFYKDDLRGSIAQEEFASSIVTDRHWSQMWLDKAIEFYLWLCYTDTPDEETREKRKDLAMRRVIDIDMLLYNKSRR